MQHASNVTHLLNIPARQLAVTGRETKPKLLDPLREALRCPQPGIILWCVKDYPQLLGIVDANPFG